MKFDCPVWTLVEKGIVYVLWKYTIILTLKLLKMLFGLSELQETVIWPCEGNNMNSSYWSHAYCLCLRAQSTVNPSNNEITMQVDLSLFVLTSNYQDKNLLKSQPHLFLFNASSFTGSEPGVSVWDSDWFSTVYRVPHPSWFWHSDFSFYQMTKYDHAAAHTCCPYAFL